MHRELISERCSIGVGSVEQVISGVSGLVEWRKLCHFESMRRRHRAEIQRYRQKYSDAIRRDIKSDCNVLHFSGFTFMTVFGLELALPYPLRPCGRF